MKLYTKRGDTGSTDLFGGQRVGKDALRVEAYGTVDELNGAVGFAAAACEGDALRDVRQTLRDLQSRLFELGADLASPRESEDDEQAVAGAARIGQSQVERIERLIDECCADLPEMKHFILPGGSEPAARLHLARGVCRRAERLCVALSKHEPIGKHTTIYLNRMSDLLFAMARQANQLTGVDDVPWTPRGEQG